MPRKIALDYDDHELRIVAAQCGGTKVFVTDAQVIPIAEGESVSEKLRGYVVEQGLARTETLVAIGRGKAELRELQLPAVPEEELPDMVRFQAIRSFASASEKASVDFLVTDRSNESTTLIAAAVSPQEIERIRELCATSELSPKRIALRPLAAAPLFLSGKSSSGICVMIDLLADDAEIVIARDGKVIFVRTVRLPSAEGQRSRAIAGEIRRTMVACGESSTPNQIVVWGNESVHQDDLDAIKSTIECDDVRAVNPFELVSCQSDELPEHAGRLAPLVGLLASDEVAADRLIDFINPRERPEEKPDHVRRALYIGLPIAAALLLAFFAFRNLYSWDAKIKLASDEVNNLLKASELADESIARTEKIDQFLDGDVSWLDELRRFADEAPPSDEMIVKSIVARSTIRGGGGTIQVIGAVTDPEVLDEMEAALRDEGHSVVGNGTSEQESKDDYRWTFDETVSVSGPDVREERYQRIEKMLFGSVDEVADAGSESTTEGSATTETSSDNNADEKESKDDEVTA
ncbi:MAG: hypothetical protein AAF802_26790 [Planctomycetota bacterium]